MLQIERDDKELKKNEDTEFEELRKGSKKINKKLLLILGCVVLGLALMLVLIGVLDRALSDDDFVGVPEGTYEFCTTYPGDIMEYDEYLALDRQIDYCDIPSGLGLTQSITEENRKDFDANVLFLYDHLQTIIAGDVAAYNACFNDTFFEANKKKTYFSPQMLYNMKITYSTAETAENGDKLVTYILEYMIYQNDGTFRRDIDSDASRPQHVTLRVPPNGDIRIERIVTKYAK